MKSDAQQAAEWAAFERGQDDVRNARPRDNRYRPASPYFDMYEQGYDAELDIQQK